MTSRHQAAGQTIQNSSEILHLLDVIIGRTARRTNDVEDFLTKAAKDVRMLAKEVNRDGQGTCGLLEFSTTNFDHEFDARAYRITTGDHDVQNLVVKNDRICARFIRRHTLL